MYLHRFLIVLISLHHGMGARLTMRYTRQSANEMIGNTFDCLYYMEPFAHGFGKNPFGQKYGLAAYRYCRTVTRKATETILTSDTTMIKGKEFSFDHLRRINISIQELFNWRAPIDIIEEYVMGKKSGTFFNCSWYDGNFWFGPRCQYTFDMDLDISIVSMGRKILQRMTSSEALLFTNGSCYPINNDVCQSVLCLDWREICDGKIDCANGLDEYRCDELEMNECNNMTEFRCQNGQCIDKVFLFDGDHDCLDLSDEFKNDLFYTQCNIQFYLKCEDRACPPTWFSCGNKQCYDGPNIYTMDPCSTQRDLLYFQRMPPSTFILFSHVSLIYDGTQPQWICYNHTLCPYLSLNAYTASKWQNGTDVVCRKFTKFMNQTYVSLEDIISHFKYFVRSCALPSPVPSSNQCSMFSCADQSKCLSKHRLSDGFNDCPTGEDEHHNNTCLFVSDDRYVCDDGTRCIHMRLIQDKIAQCVDNSDEFYRVEAPSFTYDADEYAVFRGESPKFNISFDKLCDGIQDYHPDADNNTDESDCSLHGWPCLNHITKCNGRWNCPDGYDEFDCDARYPYRDLIECSKNYTHFCLNVSDGLPFCLSPIKAGDGHIDCLGATDERSFCRLKYPFDRMRRYRCQNSDQCISPSQVCDCHQDCLENDDETTACYWNDNIRQPVPTPVDNQCCDKEVINQCHHAKEKLFLELIDHDKFIKDPFDLYEQLKNEKYSRILHSSTVSEAFIAWHCNAGLYIHSTDSPLGFYCFCPDHFYGDRCQYQRKRISFVLQPLIVGSFNRHSVYKFLILLVSQNRTIVSHDQYFYLPQVQCLSKYIAQLLYPMNESLSFSSLMNYSVHVHAFLAQTLEYLGSWQWSVPFNFLPVVKMAKRVIVDGNIITNMVPSFNRTYDGNCTACSNSSVCIGYDTNFAQDICVCPLNRTGSRCFISFDPCTETSCHGHGQCVPMDERFDDVSMFKCICDPEWYSDSCDLPSTRIDISISHELSVTPFQSVLVRIAGGIDEYMSDLTYFSRLPIESSNITVYMEKYSQSMVVIFVQIFESIHKFDLYRLPQPKQIDDWTDTEPSNINIELLSSHRCLSVKELLNATVLAQPQLRRVKYFQDICRKPGSQEKTFCFYDDQLMCSCHKTVTANCFNFETASIGCKWNKCSHRGKCIQDHARCPRNSFCLCEPCSYGSICQFTTSGYSMSLDTILGSHVRIITANIFEQTSVIKISVLTIGLFTLIGTALNVFAIGTFAQSKTRQVGCGLYLLVSSLIDLFTMIVLMCKVIVLIAIEQNSLGCSLVEFLLKWLPACSEWFRAFVAIERALAVTRRTRYSSRVSLRRAKWSMICICISISIICVPELVYRRVTIDEQDQRIWCVLTLNPDNKAWQRLYSASNILLFLIPLLINLITSIVIIMGTSYSKEKIIQHAHLMINQIANDDQQWNCFNRRLDALKKRWAPIKKQIIIHKHILIAPALLGAFSISRLVMSFTFVCTKLDRNPFLTLSAFLAGFLPSMATLFAFILSSKGYREAFITFLKAIVPKSFRNLFSIRCRCRT